MMINNITDLLISGGFRYPKDLIHVFLGGSSQHGAKLPNSGDIDIYGIYIENPLKVLGVDHEEHFTGSTQDQYKKNEAGDEDYKIYTLKRWASLACKGNPTILGFMFSDPDPNYLESVWIKNILPNISKFHASSHAAAFLGYAKGQVSRLKGEKGLGKHGQRPELANQFGYDTKAAMHLMRMMYECEEYLGSGHITYPRPEKDVLLSIRQGNWSEDKLFSEYFEAEQRVKEAEIKSPLPQQVNRQEVSKIITKAYLEHWKQRGSLESIL